MTTSSLHPSPVARTATTPASSNANRRRVRVFPAVAGMAYSAVWLAGLAVWPSNLDVTASGRAVVVAYAAHQRQAMLQYLLVEGVAAIALLGVVVTLGLAARRRGAATLSRAVLIAGIGAATLSLIQCLLGEYLAGWLAPSGDAARAGIVFDLINRMDGVKMLALAAVALAGVALVRRLRLLPRWLGFTGAALAIALILSGAGYLLLNNALALVAAVSLALLLVWVTATGIVLARPSR